MSEKAIPLTNENSALPSTGGLCLIRSTDQEAVYVGLTDNLRKAFRRWKRKRAEVNGFFVILEEGPRSTLEAKLIVARGQLTPRKKREKKRKSGLTEEDFEHIDPSECRKLHYQAALTYRKPGETFFRAEWEKQVYGGQKP